MVKLKGEWRGERGWLLVADAGGGRVGKRSRQDIKTTLMCLKEG